MRSNRGGGWRGGGWEEPFGFPGVVVVFCVAAGVVGRDQFAGDLGAVAFGAAGDLVGGDIELPFRAGPLDPARRAGVLEREAPGGQVVGVADIDDRVPVFGRVW